MTRLPATILLRVVGAALSGLVLAFAFPPYGVWPLAPVAVAGLTLTVAGVRLWESFGYGMVAGAVFFGVLIWWLRVVGVDAWVALTLFSALLYGLTAVGMTAVMRRPFWPAGIGVVWVLQEAVRDRVPWGGWPWGRLAFSQAEAPWLPSAAYGGTVLLTFLVAVSGAALAWAAWTAHRRPGTAVATLAIVCLAPWLVGLVPLAIAGQTEAGPATARIAVVQGNVPRIGLGFAEGGERRVVLDNHVRETLRLAQAVRSGAEPQPQAVIWPENSSDLDPYTQADAASAINAAARAIGVPILVGAVIVNPADSQTVLNVGIVWDPRTGPGQRYVKQHPVPFGEYVPFRGWLASVIGRFDLVPRDYAPGDRPGVLQVGPVLLGDVICFEVAYDEIVRDTVLAGARMLAVQTNNATYTGTGQTEQQQAMARIRAVEHSRTVAVAATNGISALFLPDGGLVGSIGERSAGWINAEVPLRDSLTVSDRLGPWPEAALAALAAMVTIWGISAPASVWPAGRRASEEGKAAEPMEG